MAQGGGPQQAPPAPVKGRDAGGLGLHLVWLTLVALAALGWALWVLSPLSDDVSEDASEDLSCCCWSSSTFCSGAGVVVAPAPAPAPATAPAPAPAPGTPPMLSAEKGHDGYPYAWCVCAIWADSSTCRPWKGFKCGGLARPPADVSDGRCHTCTARCTPACTGPLPGAPCAMDVIA